MPDIKKYYQSLYAKYGHEEAALGWTKNKQDIRFEQLLRFFGPVAGTVLDLGCGFGDMFKFLMNNYDMGHIKYYGVDLMDEFICEAEAEFKGRQATFICSDFLDFFSKQKECFDYIVASGIFGFKMYEEEEQYQYIQSVFERAYEKCNVGFSMNFLSDKVDYHTSDTDFHANPSRILELAYGLSRNVILDNSVMPFEFSVTVFKDSSFDVKDTIFCRYKELCKQNIC